MLLKQQLLSPFDFPNASTGLEAAKKAHEVLLERKAVGVIMGGFMRAAHQGHGWKRLGQRKDLDVLVLNKDFQLARPFEAGIDWWLPREERLRVVGDASISDETLIRYFNCNEVCLWYSLCADEFRYGNGLYLLNHETLIEIMLHEALVGLKGTVSDIDVIDEYRERLQNRFSKDIAKGVERFFGKRICNHYGVDEFSIRAMERPLAINQVRLLTLSSEQHRAVAVQ